MVVLIIVIVWMCIFFLIAYFDLIKERDFYKDLCEFKEQKWKELIKDKWQNRNLFERAMKYIKDNINK